MGLKSSNQHLTLEVSKLNEEKKTLEFKYEALKNEHDKINETRLNEKLKIDSLISFCNLIENCNLPSEDLAQQLTHLPEIITNYLKGYVSTLTFRYISISMKIEFLIFCLARIENPQIASSIATK